jgi:hypothetical protein
MSTLSVLIPARNEEWLNRTIQDVLDQMCGDTEVIAVLDGNWPLEPIPDHPRVHLVYHPVAIGQRQSVNEAARLSTAKYVMKLDAHCRVDEGFDVKLMEPYEMGEIGMDTTTIPRMLNLHVFNWKCQACGHETYQGPALTDCVACKGKGPFERVVVWEARKNRITDYARFSTVPKFEYWRQYASRPESQGDIVDVMCHVGAGWMMPRERYWDIGGLDERHGGWGQMGIEVSCKSWLSGGRQVVNKRTWFSHLFRTQPGFGFPWPLKEKDAEAAREYSRQLWFKNTWPGQAYPLSWLIEKFAPVPDWHEPPGAEKLAMVEQAGDAFRAARKTRAPSKAIVYYTNNLLRPDVFQAVQSRLAKCRNGHDLVSVSLAPLDFGRNIVMPGPSGRLSYFQQILAGLEATDADIVFLCEHDVLYDPSYFTFMPPRDDTFYYQTNVWRVDAETGKAITYDYVAVSQLCAYRALLLDHYRRMVVHVAAHGYDKMVGYEPGNTPHKRPGITNAPVGYWRNGRANIDIRHDGTLTASRWSTSEFHDKRTCANWQEADGVPGWGMTKDRFAEWLQEQG